MKLTNKSKGGLALNNVTNYTLILKPDESLVIPNEHLIKGYQKVLDIFKHILVVDYSEQENKVEVKAEQPKEEIKETVTEELTETVEEKEVVKSKRPTKKDK